MIKKVSYLFTALVLFFGFSITVSANTVDLSKKGSIEITLKESENNKIKDAEITLYHVADATEVNNNLLFSLRSDLNNCSVNLDDLTDSNLESEIAKCINENTTKYVSITNSNGIVKFNNLDLGLYLAVQTKSVEGYSDIDSFLVAIPKVEDNNWIYDIKSKPKTDVYKVIDVTVKKTWNSSSKNLPNEVTIELYEEDELIDTVKLNDENNWTYTFENIKMSDKYNVREINVPKGYTPSYKQEEYVFTVTNTDVLANTGQIFYPIIVLSFLGIVLILSGIKIIKNEV